MKKARPIPTLVALLAVVPLSLGAPPVHAQPPEATEHSHLDRHHSHHGYLGVSVRPLNSDLRRHFGAPEESGVLVASVERNSPAARAGLAVGDVIVEVDGRPIYSVAALYREIRHGHEVEIALYRDGVSLTVEAELESKRADFHGWDSDWEDWGEGWTEWGEEWGEGWAEWGEHFGEHWAEFGAEIGEHWAERGAEWGEIGAEISARIAESFVHLDLSEMDRAIEESMRALDAVDWDEIGDQIEDALEEVDEALDDLDLEDDSWR